jgi:hypothetical protein
LFSENFKNAIFAALHFSFTSLLNNDIANI